MKKDSLLMDLTSLKAGPVRAMLEASASEVIGLHPLFGPGVPSLEGQNIVLCRARGTRWLPWVRDIFGRKNANLIEATPERHDEVMAVVQALNHIEHDRPGSVDPPKRHCAGGPGNLFHTHVPGKLAMIDKVFSTRNSIRRSSPQTRTPRT